MPDIRLSPTGEPEGINHLVDCDWDHPSQPDEQRVIRFRWSGLLGSAPILCLEEVSLPNSSPSRESHMCSPPRAEASRRFTDCIGEWTRPDLGPLIRTKQSTFLGTDGRWLPVFDPRRGSPGPELGPFGVGDAPKRQI